MQPENFPQAPFRAIALNRVSHGGGGSNHAEALHSRFQAESVYRFSCRLERRADQSPQRERSAIDPAAVFANRDEITLASQMLLGAKTHGSRKRTQADASETVRQPSDACDPLGGGP